jgi:outer membrane protein TolC
VPNPVVRGFYRQELFDERIAGAELSVPLPIWNREQGTETALRAGASAVAAEIERLVRAIPREVNVAVTRRRLAAAAWQRSRGDILPAVAAARALLERGDTAGYIALPERLVQQDRLIAAETASIDAWRALHVAHADVIEAVGGTLP